MEMTPSLNGLVDGQDRYIGCSYGELDVQSSDVVGHVQQKRVAPQRRTKF